MTSPLLPGLVTEGDSLEEAIENVKDALRATLELYEDTGQPIPVELVQDPEAGAMQFSHLPGTPVGKVPVGPQVQLEFEAIPATGQKVPEWRVVS